LGIGLLAVVALLALTAASAMAATPIAVTETTDAPLESGASACESTDSAKGCTLRAAVELADAEGGEVTIDVPAGAYKETATEPTLVIDDGAEVTISGAGAENTIIEGEAKARILEVQEGGSLKLDGVTVTNGGDEENGGAVFVSPFASLIVEDSTITENTAEYGGGIYGEYLAEIAVVGSTIDENYADSEGGGIYAEGSEILGGSHVSVKESKITKNRAHYDGGGIASDPETTVLVEKSIVADNEAEDDGEGGGIAAYMQEDSCEAASRADGIHRTTSSEEVEPNLTIDQSTIEHNSASLGGGVYTAEEFDDECGGARGASAKAAASALRKSARADSSLLELEPSLMIDQSTIAYNHAESDDDGGYGGGIYEQGFVDPIVNSTIADNFATNDGGGVAIADGAAVALISDTVFDNTVEPEELESDGKSVRRAILGYAAEGAVGPGNNLATDDDGDDYALLRNTIVAEPNASLQNCEGYFESLVEHAAYNLDYPSTAEGTLDSCGMSAEENDLVGVPPGLDEEAGLASNGGPTQTIALLSNSPAIGFVPLSEDCDEAVFGPSGVDERGLKRPGIAGKGCDIGAYEYQEPAKQEVKNEEKAPAPAPAASSVLSVKISSPAQCASKRDITIHIQNVKHFGIASAVVSIDGHDKKTLSGKHLSTGINLRGLPPGTFTVEIVAHTHSGHTLKGKRVYHTCHTKLPGHSYLRL
jgi:hypothetical protein